MKPLSQAQMRELRELLATVGVEIKAKPRPRSGNPKPKFVGLGRLVHWYNGIPYDQCKGVLTYYKGPLYQQPNFTTSDRGGPWPSDIADYYKGKESK